MDESFFLFPDGAWRRVLADEFSKPYFRRLEEFTASEYAGSRCHPDRENIFAAFERTPFDEVKVVILGQDPYHEPGEAQGLAFYVPPSVKTPPSLVNIAKELAGVPTKTPAKSVPIPDLLSWADQGVLLLNATLTVRSGAAASHTGRGWETFTDAAIHALAERREHLVFILWGAHAQKKAAFVDPGRHLVLASAHPSPLSASRGFFGSRPFAKTNEYLGRHGLAPIDWLAGAALR